MDRLVPALGGADRPRAADVVRRGGQRVVAAPCGARGRSDGSAAGRARRSPSAATYGSRASQSRTCRARRLGAARAREELVPGARSARARDRRPAETRPGRRSRSDGRDGARRSAASVSSSASVAQRRSNRCACAQLRGPRLQRVADRRRRARAAAASIRSAPDQRGDAQVVGVDAALEVVPPRQERVDPGARPCTGSGRPARATNAPRQRSLPSALIGTSSPAVIAFAPPAQRRTRPRRGRRRSSRPRPRPRRRRRA